MYGKKLTRGVPREEIHDCWERNLILKEKSVIKMDICEHIPYEGLLEILIQINRARNYVLTPVVAIVPYDVTLNPRAKPGGRYAIGASGFNISDITMIPKKGGRLDKGSWCSCLNP